MANLPRGKPFEKGNPGKPKGATDTYPRTVKETVLKVFNELQGNPKHNLTSFAEKYPRDFYTIAAKLIPTEIAGKVETVTQIIGMTIVNDTTKDTSV